MLFQGNYLRDEPEDQTLKVMTKDIAHDISYYFQGVYTKCQATRIAQINVLFDLLFVYPRYL